MLRHLQYRFLHAPTVINHYHSVVVARKANAPTAVGVDVRERINALNFNNLRSD